MLILLVSAKCYVHGTGLGSSKNLTRSFFYCSLDDVELGAGESRWLREYDEETGVDRALEDEDGLNSDSEDGQEGTGGLED